jgi:hypothetical protein
MSSAARRERDALRLRALQLDDNRRQPVAGGRVVPPQPISAVVGAPGMRPRRPPHEGGGAGGGGPSYEYDAAPAPAGFAPDVVGGSSRNAMLQAKLARKQQENLRREQELRVRCHFRLWYLVSRGRGRVGAVVVTGEVVIEGELACRNGRDDGLLGLNSVSEAPWSWNTVANGLAVKAFAFA